MGAGLGGLSTALWLTAAGREVTVVEREAVPGGRAGVWQSNGFTCDTGPTVLTMPDLIEQTFACVGERMTDWLTLNPLDPLYRARFQDGSQLDVQANPEAMAAEISRLCGAREADGYIRFHRFMRQLYRFEMDDFIDHNIDSPWGMLTPNLARLAAVGGFRRLAGKVGSYLHDPRTQKVFSFQAMYAGVSPFQALALYAVISYMDTIGGVYFPSGGLHTVPEAMAAAAQKHGAEFRYSTEVAKVEVDGNRATAVITGDGERIPADVVVLNPDLPIAYRDLLGRTPRSVRRLHYSPSCFLLLAGSRAGYDGLAHHNIHFGEAWRGTFRELLHEGRLPSDPSFLVTNPTHSDPSLAPPGKHTYYVLFPTPNLDAGLDWTRLRSKYRDEVVATLERTGYHGFGSAIEVEDISTPADWARRGMAAGTPFASAHSLFQTGPFRPSNLWGENVVFTGSGTRPGVGVPMVLISGRLAAERIVGYGKCDATA
ncbi:phytoene desaturase family protein [Amycolatopsis speibonae]|uniref:Phytoene desaturase family protein n=1 Tax=Amycolatopsis speibonae TaxID=1450224 RepID=A0ABV7PEF2_9PSEU